MQLADVAAELYGLTLDEFTAARNAATATADDPAGVRGLRKPSASAWVVNMLVRHRPAEIDDVLELGVSLRQAQADLDAQQLRGLGRQRSQLVAAVAEHGRQLAGDLGQSVSGSAVREVEQTLQAAMADSLAAAAVRSGCLVHAITPDDLEPADLTAAVALPVLIAGSLAGSVAGAPAADSDTGAGSTAGPGSTARASGRVPSDSDRRNTGRLQEAKRVADEAEQRARLAAAERESIESQLVDLASNRADLESQLAALESQLRALAHQRSELQDTIAGVDRRVRNLTRQREKAERLGSEAQSAADRARERWRLLS
jgi:hypothetical protein